MKNSFTTATLNSEDITNYASASADSMGIGVSYSYHNSNAPDDSYYNPNSTGKYDIAKQIAGNLANNAEDSKSHTSTTYSGINTTNITISDKEAQLELTGKTAEETIAQIHYNTIADLANSLQEIDYQAMADDVEVQKQFNNTINQVATKFTDESFRTMFLRDHPLVEITEDENGKTKIRQLTDDEKLQAGSNGKINIAINGIFNDEEAAVQYAKQHADNEGPIYAIIFPEANNAISELLIAGYQKFLENDFWGLTNSTQKTKEAMTQYGNEGLDLDGHSRGSMTVGNAMEALKDAGYINTLQETSINFYGAAYNAQQAANLLYSLSGHRQDSINFQVHQDDFVGTIIGGNPSTGGQTPDGSNKLASWYKMFNNPATAHSCYGSGGGKSPCEDYWGPNWENSDYKTEIVNANNRGGE
jgi:filamentous hemagglutinin